MSDFAWRFALVLQSAKNSGFAAEHFEIVRVNES
jgi:hypothetical protein